MNTFSINTQHISPQALNLVSKTFSYSVFHICSSHSHFYVVLHVNGTRIQDAHYILKLYTFLMCSFVQVVYVNECTIVRM